MKSWIVNCSLLLALCCSSYLYTEKFARPSGQDRLIAGLAGVRRYVHPGASVGFVNGMPPDVTTSGAMQYFPDFLHFVLIPGIINIGEPLSDDTMLVIFPGGSSDSTRAAMINGATVIWENADSQYHYLLIY